MVMHPCTALSAKRMYLWEWSKLELIFVPQSYPFD